MEFVRLPGGRKLFTDVRYSASQRDVRRYTTDGLRSEFLIENLHMPDEVVAVYSHMDRMVTLGCMPMRETLPIDKGIDVWTSFSTEFFLERREIGTFNIRETGATEADSRYLSMGCEDYLYITMGARGIVFPSKDEANPVKFFMVSASARCTYETTFTEIADTIKKPLDNLETANKRVINQFTHPDMLKTCQPSMGLTILKPGSVWGTIPVHTYKRRMGIYTYIDIPRDNMVLHFMGSPAKTQHLVVQNEQAVISPNRSIHSGYGASHYSFI